jgi:hypothetical protein
MYGLTVKILLIEAVHNVPTYSCPTIYKERLPPTLFRVLGGRDASSESEGFRKLL